MVVKIWLQIYNFEYVLVISQQMTVEDELQNYVGPPFCILTANT